MISWMTQNWGIKLISLFFAIGLWFYAVGEESLEVKRRIPLKIEMRDEKMSILKSSVKYVWVSMSVPRNLLSTLEEKEIYAEHKMGRTAKTTRDYSFRLQSREIKLPSPQIRVLRILPETIHVQLDELIVQKVKITPAFVGEPAFGYTIQKDQIELNPNAILLEGPKGHLEKISEVKTEKIDTIGRIRSFRRTVMLDFPGNVKPLSESKVDIVIPIKEEFDEKTVEQVPIRIVQDPDDKKHVKVEPKNVSLTLKGSKKQLETLSTDTLLAYLNVTDLGEGEHRKPLHLVLPEGVRLKEEVTVWVTIKAPEISA